jgi:AraC-like DNA-binding protein
MVTPNGKRTKLHGRTRLNLEKSYPPALRRAISFMGEHAQDKISLVDIAAYVYVTPRSLQYMFRKHTELTPMGYLKQLRLHLAHMDLVTHEKHQVTISAVARKWKFGHSGRFAAMYQQAFGCTPAATLHQPSPETAEHTADGPALPPEIENVATPNTDGAEQGTAGGGNSDIHALKLRNQLLEEEILWLRLCAAYLLQAFCRSIEGK